VTHLLVGIAGALFAVLLLKSKLQKPPKRILNPVLGVLHLGDKPDYDAATPDLEVLTPFFSQVYRSAETPPPCDVLLLYCEITADGQVTGSRLSVREIVRDAGASVVVIARDHPVKCYIAGAPQLPFGRTNLIMTLKRNDPAFPAFLGRLFAEMKTGTPLPSAWQKIATPPTSHLQAPDLIFSSEIGPIAFG
jgi:hypothetical protein